jgi:acetyl-CoA carboxylase carboxyltransferase component
MNNQEKLQELFELKEHIRLGGGEDKIKKQHEKGKLTARERLDYLFDEGTFQEYNMFAKHRCTYFGMDKVDLPADGVVTGYGEINGRKAFAYAHDFTVIGGANGEVQNLKVNHVLTLARQALVPCIGLFDSGCGRIQEGGDTSAGYVFHGNVMNSGVVPQINALMGPCAGAAVYSPALTDFILAVDKTCHAHITGPKAIERVTGEIIDSETL